MDSTSSTGKKHLPPALSAVQSGESEKKKLGESSEKPPKSFKIKLPKDAPSLAGSDREGSVTSTTKGSKTSKSSKLPKKRKAGEEDGATNARKAPMKSSKSTDSTKKEKKVKKTEVRPKGPVDVEKQCGVPLPQGGMCARSLTCKSHSMGSKRAVTGRSQPYDILLAQYQKKNHAKLSMSTMNIFELECMSLILDRGGCRSRSRRLR